MAQQKPPLKCPNCMSMWPDEGDPATLIQTNGHCPNCEIKEEVSAVYQKSGPVGQQMMDWVYSTIVDRIGSTAAVRKISTGLLIIMPDKDVEHHLGLDFSYTREKKKS